MSVGIKLRYFDARPICSSPLNYLASPTFAGTRGICHGFFQSPEQGGRQQMENHRGVEVIWRLWEEGGGGRVGEGWLLCSSYCRNKVAMQSSLHSFMDASPFRIYSCPIFYFWFARIVLNMKSMALKKIIRFGLMQLNEFCEKWVCSGQVAHLVRL